MHHVPVASKNDTSHQVEYNQNKKTRTSEQEQEQGRLWQLDKATMARSWYLQS